MVKFECPTEVVQYTTSSHSPLESTIWCPFPCIAGKGNAAGGFVIKWNFILQKYRFQGLQMVLFEWLSVIRPLVSFTFEVHCGVPFSLHAGKGKCCIWLVNKLEISFV